MKKSAELKLESAALAKFIVAMECAGRDDNSAIVVAGRALAEEIGCDMSLLGSHLDFDLYCNDDDICATLGLLGDYNIAADCHRIAADAGVCAGDVRCQLHRQAEYLGNMCFYTASPTFLLVDLAALQQEFC